MGDLIEAMFVEAVTTVVFSIPGAFVLMALCAEVHDSAPAVPAIGYMSAYPIFLLAAFTARFISLCGGPS